MEIVGAGINVGKFIICRSGQSVSIACVYNDTEKNNFIVNVKFLSAVKNGVIVW